MNLRKRKTCKGGGENEASYSTSGINNHCNEIKNELSNIKSEEVDSNSCNLKQVKEENSLQEGKMTTVVFTQHTTPKSKTTTKCTSKKSLRSSKSSASKLTIDANVCSEAPFPSSFGLAKINYDVKIDPSVKDKYTPVVLTAASPPPESPESVQRRIDVIAKHGRLNPAYAHLNQGPVENPPLITPGIMVGYTPAGQRHEVNLNEHRPTWFNSEYSRIQFDEATRINVSRMFHDLSTGMFLPECLDANVERRYIAEQDLATEDAEGFLENLEMEEENALENLRLLGTEKELIDLTHFAVIKMKDFPDEMASKLHSALSLEMTPLMFIKHPIILDTFGKLCRDENKVTVSRSARALMTKIKSLFMVPKRQSFHKFFFSEVERFKELTKHMTPMEIFTLTVEPSLKSEEILGNQHLSNNVELNEEQNQDDSSLADEEQHCPNLSEESSGDEWVAVGSNDEWVDFTSSEDENVPPSVNSLNSDVGDESQVHQMNDSQSDNDESDVDENNLEVDDDEDDNDIPHEELVDLLVESFINGMIFVDVMPGFVTFHYFESI